MPSLAGARTPRPSNDALSIPVGISAARPTAAAPPTAEAPPAIAVTESAAPAVAPVPLEQAPEATWTDLITNRPGQATREQVDTHLAVRVDAHVVPYLPNSEFEADRVRRILTERLGWEPFVHVRDTRAALTER